MLRRSTAIWRLRSCAVARRAPAPSQISQVERSSELVKSLRSSPMRSPLASSTWYKDADGRDDDQREREEDREVTSPQSPRRADQRAEPAGRRKVNSAHRSTIGHNLVARQPDIRRAGPAPQMPAASRAKRNSRHRQRRDHRDRPRPPRTHDPVSASLRLELEFQPPPARPPGKRRQ
jgi:hypothetical protein